MKLSTIVVLVLGGSVLTACSMLGTHTLPEIVQQKVASGEMTQETANEIIQAYSGTLGYYVEHAVDWAGGAIAAYFGIDIRDKWRARRARTSSTPPSEPQH